MVAMNSAGTRRDRYGLDCNADGDCRLAAGSGGDGGGDGSGADENAAGSSFLFSTITELAEQTLPAAIAAGLVLPVGQQAQDHKEL